MCDASKNMKYYVSLVLYILDGIVKHMRSKAGPSSKLLLTVADAEKFIENQEHAVVGMSH